MCLLFLGYSHLPPALRPFNADPLVAVILVTMAARRMWLGDRYPALWGAAALAGLYGLACAASLVGAADLQRGQAALVRYAKDAALFVLVAASLSTLAALRRATWTLVAAGILVTAFSIYQHLAGTFDVTYAGLATVWKTHLYGTVEGFRTAGPLGDPNYYAQILVPLLALAFGLSWYERKPWLRASAAAAMLAVTLTVVFTYSRGGLLALGFVMLLLVAAFTPRTRSALVVAALLACSVPFLDAAYVTRARSMLMLGSATAALSQPEAAPALPARRGRPASGAPAAARAAQPAPVVAGPGTEGAREFYARTELPRPRIGVHRGRAAVRGPPAVRRRLRQLRGARTRSTRGRSGSIRGSNHARPTTSRWRCCRRPGSSASPRSAPWAGSSPAGCGRAAPDSWQQGGRTARSR